MSIKIWAAFSHAFEECKGTKIWAAFPQCPSHKSQFQNLGSIPPLLLKGVRVHVDVSFCEISYTFGWSRECSSHRNEYQNLGSILPCFWRVQFKCWSIVDDCYLLIVIDCVSRVNADRNREKEELDCDTLKRARWREGRRQVDTNMHIFDTRLHMRLLCAPPRHHP